jgi:tRNA 2-thiocytidine biosynthesis protein TtcA
LAKQDKTFKALKRNAGKAIYDYRMISDGDRIAVGLSGGADSMTLLWYLRERMKWLPIRYHIEALYIDPGFEGGCAEALERFCAQEGYRLTVEFTDDGIVGHSAQNRENPCFLCSRLRRKRLFEMADALDCNKLALGHNKDDLIQTLFINICFAGEIGTMLPSQSFFGGRFQVIRPLAYVDQDLIRKFHTAQGWPQFINPCPSAQRSERHAIKQLLDQLYRSNAKIKGNIFRALHHVKPDYLLKSRN